MANDGGPAFPRQLPKIELPPDEASEVVRSHAGMTMRDYFAASALTGMIANPDFGQPTSEERGLGKFGAKVARLCYEFADAMLTDRSSPPAEKQ